MDSEEQQRVDQKVMDNFGVYYKDLLVRVHNCGITLAWSNEQLLRWYEKEGRKLQVKRPFRKLPAVMVYLLRRNDQSLLAGNERVMTSTRQLEKTRSEELRRLRAEVEAFAFDKQNWAIQCTAMQKRIAELEQELVRSQDYAEALETCCGKVGLPVSAIRQAGSAVASGDVPEESEEEEVLAIANKPRRQAFSAGEISATPRRSTEPTPSTVTKSYYRPCELGQPWQRSPMMTRHRASTLTRTPVKVAVLKTVTNADDTVTVISRPLTCEECARHKEVVGPMPRRGPFQPYWDNLMLQASVYNLELRDVWQVALLTIPEELRSQLPEELKTGAIMVKGEDDEDDSVVYDRLKEALLRLRGPTHAAWHTILDIRQAQKEAFEVFAERMWVSFKEHSGIENANRDQEVLLQLLKNNAGSHIQQALANGADPPENTFRSLVEWASKIENRLAKQGKPRTIAATQWVAEGKGGASPQGSGNSSQRGCPFCNKPNHSLNQCWVLRDSLGLPRQSSQSILQDLRAIQSSGRKVEEQNSTGQKLKNASNGNTYSALQAALAALAASSEDSL